MLAVRALNLAPRQLLVALEMLVAVRTGEFEFTHGTSLLAPRFILLQPFLIQLHATMRAGANLVVA